MDDLELVRKIGDEVCEGCDENRDCGIEYDDCDRINNALMWLDEYIDKIDS